MLVQQGGTSFDIGCAMQVGGLLRRAAQRHISRQASFPNVEKTAVPRAPNKDKDL